MLYSGVDTGNDNSGEMKPPMHQNNTDHPRGRADRQGEGLDDVRTSQIRRVDCCMMNK